MGAQAILRDRMLIMALPGLLRYNESLKARLRRAATNDGDRRRISRPRGRFQPDQQFVAANAQAVQRYTRRQSAPA